MELGKSYEVLKEIINLAASKTPLFLEEIILKINSNVHVNTEPVTNLITSSLKFLSWSINVKNMNIFLMFNEN